jgi:apolipoprotein D and lipocalin family protein
MAHADIDAGKRRRPAVRRVIRAGLMVAIVAVTSSLPAAQAPLDSIEGLNLARYMGRWYEIAKYPNVFQRKCVADTTADYLFRLDGSVQVTNRCRIADDSIIQAVGKARSAGGIGSSRLEVTFVPSWLRWLPLVWADYWVVDLDEQYMLAAVSEPERDYLWILSRTPQVPGTKLKPLLARLENNGFELSRLEWTRHSTSP